MQDEKKIIRKITLVGIIGNVALSAFKMFAGIFGHSSAMVSDAVHSLSDVVATFVAYFGTVMARRPADESHPYGHEKLEPVATIILGMILIFTALGIGEASIKDIIYERYETDEIPKMIALIAAVVSIVVKELMYWYTMHYAKILESDVFVADAWHHRGDSLSSIAALMGIAGSMLGYPVLDAVAGLVISLFILKIAFDIINDAITKITDQSLGREFDDKVRELAGMQEGVESVDKIQSRRFGSRSYVDIEIGVRGEISLYEAHDIAEKVHDAIENEFPNVKHAMVHVNPIKQ